ncbi:MAG: adenosylcobinamide-phosphate synthase CbiB [Methanomicrobium sp.]|nr:adenosylcobinamide-phosphate synthase CbiB [Methanomicrobium sp.]
MALPALILFLSLVIDRVLGDPKSRLHPVSLLGEFIGLWGKPELYPAYLQRFFGAFLALSTALLFASPFYLFERYAPVLLFLIGAPFFLKICFAWRCLEEHVSNVENAVFHGGGRNEVQMLVSRDTSTLNDEEILSAAYESMAENLVDSVVSPLFYFTFFGLFGSAFFRAFNTMDAMLGYKDERIRLGWFCARTDDILNFIPARLTGILLIFYFTVKGRFKPAWNAFLSDRKKREGFNGGIPMSLIAGGCMTAFVKPGVYVIGNKEKSLAESRSELISAFRWTAVLASVLFVVIMVLSGGIVFQVIYTLSFNF